MEIKIREEQKNDYPIIYKVVELAFKGMEFSDQTEHFLVDRLRLTDAYIPQLSLVAELNGEIVGHIMFTKAEIISDDNIVPSLILAPVSVHPNYQKSGIGGALIREAHKRAVELGYQSAVLIGHKEYYPKFGYKTAIDFGIEFPLDVPHEFCMVAELQPGSLKGVHGLLKFAQPLME